MKQYLAKIENGIIRYHLNLTPNLPNSIIEKLTLIKIHNDSKIYNNFSTYENGVFKENREAFLKAQQEKELKRKAERELREIQSWLNDNDWKINKIVIGEWETTDERWLKYIEERTQKRARRDELLAQIK